MAATTAFLSGCGDESEQVITFKNVDECKSSNKFAPEVCDASYKSAQDAASKELRYKTQSDCYSDFGTSQCRVIRDDNGNSWFVPAMAGFMVAQALNTNTYGGMDVDDIAEARYYDEKRKTEKLKQEKLKREERQTSSAATVVPRSKPLYRSKDDYGSLRTASNRKVGSVFNTGRATTVSKRAFVSKPKATTLSRGSFGSSASRGGWGG